MLGGFTIPSKGQKPVRPKVAHRIGRCANCGWVHREIRRVRVSEGESAEISLDGKTLAKETRKIAVIKAMCVGCIKEQPVYVLCDLCGNKKCDNLYPVSVARKVFGDGHSCNLFLHLCVECRQIPHKDVLERLNVPNMCDSCKDRFKCFTEKYEKPLPSEQGSGVLDGKRTFFHKRMNIDKFMRGRF